jgi:hypothetical protein
LKSWVENKVLVKALNPLMVPETGIEPVRPLFTKAADFKKTNTINIPLFYGHFKRQRDFE